VRPVLGIDHRELVAGSFAFTGRVRYP
jgi:hypothetical protein